jgi:hypothetical protein
MGAEPGGDAARLPDRAEASELRVAVEPVAGLRLERRRPLSEHPGAMALDRRREPLLPRRAGSPDRGEDASARGMQLLVARPARAKRELADAVAAEGRVRVTVDEAGNRAEPPALHLRDVAVESREVAHPPDRLDRLAGAEDERVLEHLDLAERPSAQRSSGPRGRRELREVAQEHARASVGHASPGARGIRSPPSSAAESASG